MHAPLLLLALALGVVRVEGGSACPSAEDVQRALVAMPGAEAGGYVARVQAEPDAVRIELTDDTGRPLRTRRLPGSAPCDELARAAAVIVAAWIGELRPTPAETVPLRPRARPSRVRWEVDAAFVADLSGAAFSPGAAIEVEVAPRRGRFGGRLALIGGAPRAIALPPGEVRYARPMVQLGPNVRFHPWRMLLDLHAEASLAVLVVEGQGFTTSQRDLDVDVGLGGGARAAIRAGPVAPFLGVSVVGWLRGQAAQVTGLADQARLPRYDLLLTAGLAFGVFR